MAEPKYVSTVQAAEVLEIHESSVRRWCVENKLDAVRIGKRSWAINISSIPGLSLNWQYWQKKWAKPVTSVKKKKKSIKPTKAAKKPTKKSLRQRAEAGAKARADSRSSKWGQSKKKSR